MGVLGMAGRAATAAGRRASLVTAGLAVALLLVSGFFSAAVPDALARERAYVSAPACAPGARSQGCTTTVSATVRGRDERSRGRDTRYWLRVAERDGGAVRRVRMSGSTLYDVVRAGDRVALTSWRGEVRRVRFGTAVEETAASPVGDWRLPLGVGLGTGPIALGFLGTAWWSRRRYATAAHASPWQLAVGIVGGALLGCVGFVAAQVSPGVGESLLVTALAVLPVAALTALCAGLLRRRQRRAVDTGDIVPVVPDGRRCVRAAVLGDASYGPYGAEGFDHLVVGDGPPAVTPDPDGRVARRPLPPTLSVVGVRAPRPDDWPLLAGGGTYDTVVIECRDGGATVLVVLDRADAPVVLGALRAAARAAG
ncbi:hypothetical protein [Streptomyces sp. G45]|uniref:hypothetical protein n=1 Tax=Streptomyces sp. G45 TaxID=3406627 RepID=UPI003C1E36B9